MIKIIKEIAPLDKPCYFAVSMGVDSVSAYLWMVNKGYNFYKEVVEYDGVILTAHHLNDCVESYLLNCFRGKPTHNFFELVSEFPDYKIAHPFLISRKKDFSQYVERNNYSRFIVEDETNTVVKGSRRNWIRNTIVPEMNSQKLSLEKYCLERIEDMIENFVGV